MTHHSSFLMTIYLSWDQWVFLFFFKFVKNVGWCSCPRGLGQIWLEVEGKGENFMIPSMTWLFGTYSVNTDTSDFFHHNVVTWAYFFHKKSPLYLLLKKVSACGNIGTWIPHEYIKPMQNQHYQYTKIALNTSPQSHKICIHLQQLPENAFHSTNCVPKFASLRLWTHINDNWMYLYNWCNVYSTTTKYMKSWNTYITRS
jgi:hypothetical protein